MKVARNTLPARLAVMPALAVLLVVAVDAANADTLYDTTWMTDNQTYTTSALTECYIGGAANNFGVLRDHQITDDFSLSGLYSITSITTDYLTQAATPPVMPAGGLLLEIFSDVGGHPVNYNVAPPTYQLLLSGSDVTMTNFVNPFTTFNPLGARFTLDLSDYNVTLGPGTWWLSVQPVDETPTGVRFYWVSQAGVPLGNIAHRRRGGIAHGNGYPATSGPADGTWGLFSGTGRDLAMRVEGTLIPGPGALAALGLSVMCSCHRRRR